MKGEGSSSVKQSGTVLELRYTRTSILEVLWYNPRLVQQHITTVLHTTLNDTNVENNSSTTALVQPQIDTRAFYQQFYEVK